MPEHKDERQHTIAGTAEVTTSSNAFIQETIAQLRSERLGITGPVLNATEPSLAYGPTIDTVALDQSPIEQFTSGTDPLTLPKGNPFRVVYSALQLKGAKEAGVSKKARGELKALLKAA